MQKYRLLSHRTNPAAPALPPSTHQELNPTHNHHATQPTPHLDAIVPLPLAVPLGVIQHQRGAGASGARRLGLRPLWAALPLALFLVLHLGQNTEDVRIC